MTEETFPSRLWSFLAANESEPSTHSVTDSTQTESDLPQWEQELFRAAIAQARNAPLWSFGYRRTYGVLLPSLVNVGYKRQSRRLKRLNKLAAQSKMLYWLDEPYNYLNNFYTAGESKTIEQKGYRIQALPKVSRVRGQRRRNR